MSALIPFVNVCLRIIDMLIINKGMSPFEGTHYKNKLNTDKELWIKEFVSVHALNISFPVDENHTMCNCLLRR